MNRFLIVSFFFLTLLEARENPFFPSDGDINVIHSSNEDRSLAPLKQATISLPTNARVIESVTVSYRNFDGSRSQKSIELENSIDWHLPLFISQSYTQKQQKSSKQTRKYKNVAKIKHADFYILDKSLKIITKDKLIRNFLLVKPHRIVLDFEKDTTLKNYVQNMPKEIFKKIRVGNHDGYYRVVIELDGYYKYKLSEIENGYEFNLR